MKPISEGTMKNFQQRHLTALVSLAMLALVAISCSAPAAEGETQADGSKQATETQPLAVSYANGVAILDGTSLEILAQYDSEEFTRLNAVGDGRNVLLTTSQGFQILDTVEPDLREITFAASTPGHVVRHDGKTVLFDDGTGDTTIFNTNELASSGQSLPEMEVIPGEVAHHGVSIELSDGTLVTTIGTPEARSGAKALNAQRTEVTRNEECPGVHGEGTAAGEAVIFGCEDGALLYHDGHFEKLSAPDEYGRMGNAYVSETSEIVIGDYQNDPDYEGYLLNKLALIDTAKHSFDVLHLPQGVQYTWRGVVRGPGESAYILATDGSIHVLDPTTGEITDQYPVLDAWEGPADWQDPHPALSVNGATAYVADPKNNQVHAVNLETGEKTATATLDEAPNEMAAALG